MAETPRNPADRPGKPQGSPDEGDFTWLYGQNGPGTAPEPSQAPQQRPEPTRPVRRGPRPDSAAPRSGSASDRANETTTRVMPTLPPPGSSPSSASSRTAAPSPGRIAPTPGQPASPRPKRPWLTPRNALLAVVVLLLVWVGSVIWTGLSIPGGLTHVAWEPSGARPDDQPGTTYLIVASDSRKGLSKEERKKLHTGGDVGQRTDTIKLLHTGSGPNLLLTIPRDSYVPIPGHGSAKINAAFAYGGPKLLVKTIEQDTGIRIDQYVEIGMGGLVNLVDGVGGVTICPKTNMDDKLANLHVKKGCQHADGVTALAYSRSRHAQKLGDLGRGEAQSEVIGQIGKRVASFGTLANPFRLHSLKSAVSGISVGDGMGTFTLAKFGLAFKSVAGGSALECGVPISDMYIHWDASRSKQMFSYIKEDKTGDMPKSLCTPSGLPKSVTG